MPVPTDLLTKTAASKYLGITPYQLHKLRRTGQLQHHQIDQRIFYSKAELDRYAWNSQEWLEAHRI